MVCEIGCAGLGGHLDSAQRQRASTLEGRVDTVFSRIFAVCALDFKEKLRILRIFYACCFSPC